jgi:hypothetical protein
VAGSTVRAGNDPVAYGVFDYCTTNAKSYAPLGVVAIVAARIAAPRSVLERVPEAERTLETGC